MDFALMTEPQMGGSYEHLLAAARWARAEGMVAFARSDHYYADRRPRTAATDAFATLAGLARETEGIRLCVLVSPVTFRHPAVVAKTAATIAEMSGGRLDLGVGTGWMELEHRAFGLPFPPWRERFERLEEALGYLSAAFRQSPARFEGRYYSLDAEVLPRPTGLRLVVGGSGRERTPRLAGALADEYNHFLAPPDEIAGKVEVMRSAAAAAGRDPGEVVVSAMGRILTGSDGAEYRERLGVSAARRGMEADDLERRLRESGVPHGTPERVGEMLEDLARVGVEKLYLQWFEIEDVQGLRATWEAVKLATGRTVR